MNTPTAEIAEALCAADSEKAMSDMTDVVDEVANAICRAEGDNPSEYPHYRAPARAAIDAYCAAVGDAPGAGERKSMTGNYAEMPVREAMRSLVVDWHDQNEAGCCDSDEPPYCAESKAYAHGYLQAVADAEL